MTGPTRESQCNGKKRFRTYCRAELAMRVTIRKSGEGGGGMSVYRCRYCQDYHFGHDTKRDVK